MLVVTVRGLKSGETDVKLKNPQVQDGAGRAIKVAAVNGKLSVGERGEDGGGGVSLPLIIGGALVVLAIGGGIAFAARSYSRRNV